MTHPHVVRHGAGVPLIAVHGNGVDHRLLLALVGSTPFALLANSLGGLLARNLVAQFGDQVLGLALIAPVVDPDAAPTTPA